MKLFNYRIKKLIAAIILTPIVWFFANFHPTEGILVLLNLCAIVGVIQVNTLIIRKLRTYEVFKAH